MICLSVWDIPPANGHVEWDTSQAADNDADLQFIKQVYLQPLNTAKLRWPCQMQ